MNPDGRTYGRTDDADTIGLNDLRVERPKISGFVLASGKKHTPNMASLSDI